MERHLPAPPARTPVDVLPPERPADDGTWTIVFVTIMKDPQTRADFDQALLHYRHSRLEPRFRYIDLTV